jgi:hypothetical protein
MVITSLLTTSILLTMSFYAAAQSPVEEVRAETAFVLEGNCMHPAPQPRVKYLIFNLDPRMPSKNAKNVAFTTPLPPECKPRNGVAPHGESKFLVGPRSRTRSRVT